MQFIDLAAQQKRIRERIEAGFRKILDHGQYILGPEIREIEEKLAAYVGVPHAVSVASGTDALLMPLMAENAGSGDAVFVPHLHVHRHRRRRRPHRRDAGIRRHQSGNVQHRPGKSREFDPKDHRREEAHAEGDHAGRPVRPARRLPRHPGYCRQIQIVRPGRRCPEFRCQPERQESGGAGEGGGDELLPGQAAGRLRRRRHDLHR